MWIDHIADSFATRLLACACGALALLLAAAPGNAQADDPVHKVLQVTGGRAYVGLGRRDGASPGEALDVVDALAVGGTTEYFPRGRLVIESCGEGVSLAEVPAELRDIVHPGTLVRLAPPAAPAAPLPAVPVAPATPDAPSTARRTAIVPAPVSADAPPPPDVEEPVEQTDDSPPVTPYPAPPWAPPAGTRVAPYAGTPLRPGLPAAPVPLAPGAADVPLDAGTQRGPATADNVAALGFRHDGVSGAVPPGEPLSLTLFAPPPLANPALMYRTVGAHEYTALPFAPKPDSYYVATIDADDVQSPGIEYYIVCDTPGAARTLAYGGPETPVEIGVEGRFNESRELARYGVRDEASYLGEIVPYDGLKGQDYYVRNEAEYQYRLFTTIYSLRFGAGDLFGQAFDPRSQTPDVPEKVGFLYAYTEAELRAASAPIAFIPRLIFGVNRDGVGGGAEGRLRFGDELGLNFETGVTVVSKIGWETFMQLNVHFDRMKVALSGHLEDLPFAGQLGFRTDMDLGYKLTRKASVLVRAGVAARSIYTVGPDLGLGFAYGF